MQHVAEATRSTTACCKTRHDIDSAMPTQRISAVHVHYGHKVQKKPGTQWSARPALVASEHLTQDVIRSQKPLTPSMNVADLGECLRASSPVKVDSNCCSNSR